MTSSDRFPVHVRSAVKSNFTNWCCQKLSKRDLNALTVQASTTELGKLFQIFTVCAEKKCFRNGPITIAIRARFEYDSSAIQRPTK